MNTETKITTKMTDKTQRIGGMAIKKVISELRNKQNKQLNEVMPITLNRQSP